MFEIKLYTRPEFSPLQIDDSVTWWSHRYSSWIKGTVVEMKITKRTNWVYDGAPGKYRPESRIVERVAVLPVEPLPANYPSYKLYLSPTNLSKF